ncbi:MAG TPA: DUF1440 domain-containing protein [Gemmatimonadaceae bacterium]
MPDARRMLDEIVLGAIAGAAATWVMGKVTTVLYERESRSAREREDRVRHGSTAYAVAAAKGARLLGVELDDARRERYGTMIHRALGVGTGALYAALVDRLPRAGLARGLAFGAAFFLLVDEGLVYALGLTPGPTRFPWQTHARGLAGHLVYGAVADTVVRAAGGRPSGDDGRSVTG